MFLITSPVVVIKPGFKADPNNAQEHEVLWQGGQISQAPKEGTLYVLDACWQDGAWIKVTPSYLWGKVLDCVINEVECNYLRVQEGDCSLGKPSVSGSMNYVLGCLQSSTHEIEF